MHSNTVSTVISETNIKGVVATSSNVTYPLSLLLFNQLVYRTSQDHQTNFSSKLWPAELPYDTGEIAFNKSFQVKVAITFPNMLAAQRGHRHKSTSLLWWCWGIFIFTEGGSSDVIMVPVTLTLVPQPAERTLPCQTSWSTPLMVCSLMQIERMRLPVKRKTLFCWHLFSVRLCLPACPNPEPFRQGPWLGVKKKQILTF